MKLLAFAGSARQESFNLKLLNVAVELIRAKGVEVNVFDFGKYPLPLYDGDLEHREGMPANAKRFKEALVEHDGFIIASPEYNSAYSPLLTNAIDWASRAESADEPPLDAFNGKTAALIAASPGGLGGLRGLAVLRMLLSNIRVNVTATQIAVTEAHEAFDVDGQLKDSGTLDNLKNLATEFIEFTQRLQTSD